MTNANTKKTIENIRKITKQFYRVIERDCTIAEWQNDILPEVKQLLTKFNVIVKEYSSQQSGKFLSVSMANYEDVLDKYYQFIHDLRVAENKDIFLSEYLTPILGSLENRRVTYVQPGLIVGYANK